MTRAGLLLMLGISLTALLHGDEPRTQYAQQQPRQTPQPPTPKPVVEPQPIPRLTPSQAAEAALADVKRLPIDTQQNALYLWLGGVLDKDYDRFYRVFNFHVNSLSRESDLIPPKIVHPDLWRLDIRDYGWLKAVVNKLAQVDPYFHAKLQAVAVVAVPAAIAVGIQVQTIGTCQACFFDNPSRIWGELDPGTQFTVRAIAGDMLLFDADVGRLGVTQSAVQILQSNQNVTQSAVQNGQNVVASAPWLPAQTMAELIALTQSEAPLLRADWFFAQTARQIDLNNQAIVGYYDFLQVKKEADLEELGGLDRKIAEKRRTELRAIITDSGVTLHNRQLAAIQSGYWESLDVDRNDGAANAKRQLDKDFKEIAKEVYFRLPNGLWGLGAVDVAGGGKLADSVPDKIANDKKTTSNDGRIHPGLSCIRCHVEGLRPYDDWARVFYADPPGDAKLVSVDYERLKRLRQLYLRPMDDTYEDDQRIYARALARLTGYTPKQMADNYSAMWSAYVDAPVTGAKLAAELGYSYDQMIAGLKRYAATNPLGDPVVIDFLKRPEIPNRREYVEESYPLFQLALQGVKK